MEWMTKKQLAAELGCTPRYISIALKDNGMVGDVPIAERPATEEDYAAGVCTRRTKTLVRVVREDLDAGEIEREIEKLSGLDVGELGSPEETLRWLELVRRGKIWERRIKPTGDEVKIPASLKHRMDAGAHAEKVRQFIYERDNLYIPKDKVAEALVALSSLVRDRMQAAPARLAESVAGSSTIAEIRSRLTEAVDELMLEVGDTAEREMAKVLES